jgi:hypothetical protein
MPSITTHTAYHGPIIPAPRKGAARHLNPTIAAVSPTHSLLLWRVELTNGLSRLAAATLPTESLLTAAPIHIVNWRYLPDLTDAENPEDPRLFTCPVDGGLRLLYARVRSGTTGWSVIQHCARLDAKTLRTNGDVPVRYGKNGESVEKNWTPISEQNSYSYAYLYAPDKPHPGSASILPCPYPYGSLSGRSPAIPSPPGYPGSYISIVGGFTHHPTRHRRYYIAAAAYDSQGRITHISRIPIAWASDQDPHLPCPRAIEYNPSVIFACGIQALPDHRIIVPISTHDSYLHRLILTPADLHLIPIAHLPHIDPRPLILMPGQDAPSNRVKTTILRQPIFEAGHHYHPGETIHLHPQRANALASLLKILSLES